MVFLGTESSLKIGKPLILKLSTKNDRILKRKMKNSKIRQLQAKVRCAPMPCASIRVFTVYTGLFNQSRQSITIQKQIRLKPYLKLFNAITGKHGKFENLERKCSLSVAVKVIIEKSS